MKALGVLLLAILCFVVAQGTNIPLFFYLFYLLLALLALAYLWSWSNLQGVSVTRDVGTRRAQVGEEARERLLLDNEWPLPKLWVEVQDHSDMPLHASGFVAYLPGNERRRWTVRTPCTMRGKWTLGPVTLHSGDPFGIFKLQRPIDSTTDIIVYPATIDLPDFKLPSAELPGGADVRTRSFHVTPNVSTIRDYVFGDSFNRIHWRSTARTGKMMVKEFELDPTADVWIVVDMHERSQAIAEEQRTLFRDRRLGRDIQVPESTEEYIVSAAASIGRHLLNGSRNVGLLSWGQHREVIPPEREARQLYKMLESLAIVRAHGTHSLQEVLIAESSQFSRSSTMVVITASVDPTWVTSLQQLLYRGIRAVVVFVDQESFGGLPGQSTLRKLNELNVPVYKVEQGQPLDQALQQPSVVGRGAR
ncbi:MAG: DUF58 domain-containing protein [Chloroflexota bacterium]|nr:DUF58 domain-containing protein [Chloroflexota bacterium]PLS78440.1 MAG: DUF58 domain-containing protein [Chloroflexota bacterium]